MDAAFISTESRTSCTFIYKVKCNKDLFLNSTCKRSCAYQMEERRTYTAANDGNFHQPHIYIYSLYNGMKSII